MNSTNVPPKNEDIPFDALEAVGHALLKSGRIADAQETQHWLDFWANVATYGTEGTALPVHEVLAINIVSHLAARGYPLVSIYGDDGLQGFVDDLADAIEDAMPSLDVGEFTYLHRGKPSAADYEAESKATADTLTDAQRFAMISQLSDEQFGRFADYVAQLEREAAADQGGAE